MNTKSTESDLPKEARQRAVALLNRQLANTLDLRLRANEALRNVRGSRFSSLQKLCNQVAQANLDASEILAKRVVELGGVVELAIQGAKRNSRFDLRPTPPTGAPDQLREFCGAFVLYTASIREATKVADLTGDYGTGDILTLISRTADRLLWRIGANLCDTWDSAVLPVAARPSAPVELVEVSRGKGC